MNAPVWGDVLCALAQAVPCPTCSAKVGRPCVALRKGGLPHLSRQDRGVASERRALDAQHKRAMAALSRVRAAGCRAKYADVTTVLACACSECLHDMVELARELAGYGLLDAAAVAR